MKKQVYFAGVGDLKRLGRLLENDFKYFMGTFAAPLSKNVLKLIRSYPDTVIMMDSGAFTAYNSGKQVDIDKYIKYIKDNNIDVYFNLDVIGDVEGTKRNQAYMESQGLTPIPVFHYGEPMEYLQWLVDQGYTYIGLGGSVGKSVKARREFFKDIFYLYPHINFHGLGVTAKSLVEEFNWYSVDSTTWLRPFKNKVYLNNEGKSVKAEDMESFDRFDKSLDYFRYLNNLDRLDEGDDVNAFKED